MDIETQRYAEIIKAKQARLFVLDKQAATYGIDVPPHIEMERVSLHEELRMVETAIASPARADVGDELGPRGRFIVNHQENREIKQSIAAVAVKLDQFIEQSDRWRDMHRQLILLIGVAVIGILVVLAIIVTYLVTTGHL